MVPRFRRLLLTAGAAMVCTAMVCAAMACAAPAGKPPAPTPPTRPLHRGPLTDFISAAGLRWLLLLEPRQVLSEPELGRAISEVIPSARFDAFAEASGVDLRVLPRAA